MTGKNGKIELKNATGYGSLVSGIGELLEAARHTTTRSVNAIMTATYWEIGRRIVEFEQKGAERAQYGKGLLKRLSGELTERFGRGFSQDNLERFRLFYLRFPPDLISETASRKSPDEAGVGKRATASRELQYVPLQATTTEKSATVLRISGDLGGVIDVAHMVEAFHTCGSHPLRAQGRVAGAIRHRGAGERNARQQVSHCPAGRGTSCCEIDRTRRELEKRGIV